MYACERNSTLFGTNLTTICANGSNRSVWMEIWMFEVDGESGEGVSVLQSAYITRASRNIANPSIDAVILVFENSQVSHLKAGWVVHWNFEVESKWTNLLTNTCLSRCWEGDLASQRLLLPTAKLLDTPHDLTLLCIIFGGLTDWTNWQFTHDGGSRLRHWNRENDITTIVAFRNISTNLNNRGHKKSNAINECWSKWTMASTGEFRSDDIIDQ